MGILNATPDSFSDEQRPKDPDELAERGHALVAAGAAIVDVGGESGRTDTVAVPVEEEAARVVPLVERLAAAGVARLGRHLARSGGAARARRPARR